MKYTCDFEKCVYNAKGFCDLEELAQSYPDCFVDPNDLDPYYF